MRLKHSYFLPVLMIAAQMGCAGPPPDVAPTLEVAYAGCERVRRGPICYLENGATLSLWARAEVEVELDVIGPVRRVTERDVQAGRLFRVRPEVGAGTVRVMTSGEHGEQERFRLEFRPMPLKSAVVLDAEALFDKGLVAEALGALEEGWGAIDDIELGAAWRLRGRIERALGNTDSFFAFLHKAVEILEEKGWLYQTGSAVVELAYGLIYSADRFAEARELLETQGLDPDAPAEVSYGLAYLGGLLALNTGDVRGSLVHLRESVEVADRLGLDAWRMSAEQPLAHQLQRVGRSDESAAIFSRHRRDLPEDLGPCDRASLLNNLAWNQLLIRESTGLGQGGEDPTAWLLEARELFRDRPCVETDERANVELNLALAALHREDPSAAREHLEKAAVFELQPDLRSRFWRLEIEARIAMQSRRPEQALERYRYLKTLASQALATKTLWRAEAGQAQALEALGRLDEALSAYRKAEVQLDLASLAVPIDSGREGFFDRGLRVTRRHLDLLVERGQVREAFELGRRVRSRVVRSLHRQSRLSRLSNQEQREWDAAISAYRAERRTFEALVVEEWRLSAEQLERRLHDRQQARGRLQQALDAAFATLDILSPGFEGALPALVPGEVRLLYFPGAQGWIGFAESSSGLVARRLGEISPEMEAEALGKALFEPFATTLEGASAVRILPFAWLRDVDLHVLSYDGREPLLARHPVVYGLDLPVPRGVAERAGQALIVADPTGDLAAARSEGRRVAEQLRPHWKIRQLQGQDATSSALRRWLPGVDLFHYAGHGLFAGREGWHSALPLAGDSLLTLADILALERAPRQVVLSACETGRSAPDTQVESVTGLAHAFLTAGSRSVVATVRPVEDRMAAELVRRYYGALLEGEEPAEALRRAQMALRDSDPGGDWASFRLLEP